MGEDMGGAGAVSLVLALLAGYGLGSIPFGLLLTRWAGAGDIRTIGSGNIGATNVLRTGRKGLALATLLLDLAKGAIPTALGLAWLGPLGAVLGGAGAIIGHCFPVWLGFRGGKGVATAAGVVLGLTPTAVRPDPGRLHRRRLGHPLGVARLHGRGLPGTGGGVLLGNGWAAGLYLLVAALVVYKHRENIGRLLKGEESRLSFGGKPAT